MNQNNHTNQFEEREIKEEVFLCNKNGLLNWDSVGWSRNPLQVSNLSGNWLRKKKWNYWCVVGKDYMFSITLTDLDYSGMVFAYYLNYKTKEFFEDSILISFGLNLKMGERVGDDAVYKSKKCTVEMLPKNGYTELKIDWKDFIGKPLKSELKVHNPKNHETLNVVVPWSDSQFQFTSKHHTLPTEGYFIHGEKKIQFRKDETLGCLDFGRGIWPRSISWNWGGVSGMSDNALIGLNLGAKWTDNTGISENSICLDGKLEKIKEPLQFTYNTKNFMEPWKIQSTIYKNVDLVFTPFYERVAVSNFLIIQSEVHQLFGHYKGRINFQGREYYLENLTGWAEEHFAKW
ncbi:MAG: DUF2804 domain-containing protein [Leptospiraceae bacterium]|nr:DUF2804 domain-containing protein [Leptospiraceae bacterium]MCK6381827.1 DUF2804 domain-containing protein [Leptospiraceae bacterium]NUM40967.1 DUF2804 domain-containing protein [Leptospiraceae bacterium]